MKRLLDITISDILDIIKIPEVWLNFKALCIDDGKVHQYQANLNTGNVYRGQKRNLNNNAIVITAQQSRFAVKADTSKFFGVLCAQTIHIKQYDVLAQITYLCDCGNIMPYCPSKNQIISERKQLREENAIIMKSATEPGSIGQLIRNNNDWTTLNNNERVTVLSVEIINRNKERKMINSNPEIRPSCSETPISCFDSKKNICTEYLDMDIVSKYFGEVYIGANNYQTLRTEKDFVRFMQASVIKRKNSANQSKIEKLTSIVLPDVHDANKYYDFAYVSRVNDEYAVIRWIENGTERKRLYVSKKEHLYCRVDVDGNWCYYHGRMNVNSFDVEYVYLESPNVCDGTKMEYFQSICSKIQNRIMAKTLYVLIMYPDFERVYKAGFENVCMNFLYSDCQFNWIKYVKNYFGQSYDAKESNLHKCLGLNKYQIEKFIKARTDNTYSPMPRNIKNIFNMNSIADIDNNSFNLVFNFISDVIKVEHRLRNSYSYDILRQIQGQCFSKTIVYSYVVIDALAWISEMYSTQTMLKMVPKLKSCYDDVVLLNSDDVFVQMMGNRASVSQILRDILMMIRFTNSKNIIKPYFDTPQDLCRMHEALVDVMNAEREKKDKEMYDAAKDGFEQRKAVWAKWEYENDKYLVVSPNMPIDIAAEGIALHHCVKSYIPTIAEGKTNVLFLREKSDPSAPFFTIEISNDKSVRQIHGFGNRLVSSEPGLDEFIAEWSRAVKVKLNKIDAILPHE